MGTLYTLDSATGMWTDPNSDTEDDPYAVIGPEGTTYRVVQHVVDADVNYLYTRGRFAFYASRFGPVAVDRWRAVKTDSE